ncbi:MAG: hypothetical protein ACR2P2_07050 [Nakamurella sp.]
MTDDSGYALHSWVDESMHVDGDNGLYLLAAVVCAADGCDPIRDVLRELLDQDQPKLHWGTESPERRDKIIRVVAEVDMAAVVVIGAPLTKKKQERARAVCMETLVVHLAAMDVTHVLLEQRTPSLNDRDMKLIDAIRGKKLIPREMRIDVGQPSTEPMLWMPDIVAGAAGADRVHGNPQYLDLIRATVTQLDISLR